MRIGSATPPRARSRRAPMAEINIIPLVDVTLVLLIIFMMTTAFVKDTEKKKPETKPPPPVRELPLKLPTSGAAIERPVTGDLLILGVDKQGRKYVGAERVSTEALLARVRRAATEDPNRRVRVDADRDARFQDVVEVIELCQFEGLKNVGLHTAAERQP